MEDLFTLNTNEMRIKYKVENIMNSLSRWFQKKMRGYSDLELWNLDDTIAKWIVPRLKAFRDTTQAYPANLESFEQWQEMLGEMIFGFEFSSDEWYRDNALGRPKEEREKKKNELESMVKRAENGRVLFAKHFNEIWW